MASVSKKSKIYDVVQANLQRSNNATAELLAEIADRNICFALIQEPYIGNKGVMGDVSGARIVQAAHEVGKSNKAAILINNKNIKIIQFPNLTTTNLVAARLETAEWTIGVISYYFEPNTDIETYVRLLKEMIREIECDLLIVGGDANAWSEWWGSDRSDSRGVELAGLFVELGLEVMNEGSTPTFDTWRGGKRFKSSVDVTCCSDGMAKMVQDWRVDEGMTTSDHNAIIFKINLEEIKEVENIRTTRKYKTNKVEWSKFKEICKLEYEKRNMNVEEIAKIKEVGELEFKVGKYIESIEETCNKILKKKKVKQKIKIAWWSVELEVMKKEKNRMKRKIKWAAPNRLAHVVEQYVKSKEKYQEAMEKARIRSWKEFCEKQERETMWEGIYRVIGKTKKAYEDLPIARDGKNTSPKESVRIMAESFYPEDTELGENEDHREVRRRAAEANEGNKDDLCDPPFVEAELLQAVNSFNPKKAPGSDGFTADICAAAIKTDPNLSLAIFNKCLELSHFPKPWKEATIILLRKPNKDDYTHPKSYRPIGLLAILGKILEKILMKRIRWYVLPKLNPCQYGFVPQRSTEDSLYDMVQRIRHNLAEKKIMVLISLDIEGAFDNAWWPQILCQLKEKGCPLNLRRLVGSYLEDRKVTVKYAGEKYSKSTNKGCVQGSIGGPLLWNLILDPLLNKLTDANVYCQAFADDIILVIEGSTAGDITNKANSILSRIQKWGESNKLNFAPQKTKAMVITNKLKFDTPRLEMGGTVIETVGEIKILGVIFDSKLLFNKHISYICKKVINIYKGVCRAARATWGLHPEIIRTIYKAVIEPTILYAASVWSKEAKKAVSRKALDVVLRGFAQKITRSNKTVSLNAALILSGLLPLDLRIQEASQLFEAKRGKPQAVLSGRRVEQRVPYTENTHPSRMLNSKFTLLENAEEDSKLAEGLVKIYTDGSKLEGKVGAALTCWKGKVETCTRKFRLEPYCTVFQAELYAILQATEIIIGKKFGEAAILSDSRSALQTLMDPDSSHPITKAIQGNLEFLRDNHQLVSLYWIRAHVGVGGNERADELAKEAALKLKTRADYDCCPISYVKRHLRAVTIEQWDSRYRTEATAATTKVFFPNGVDAYNTVRKMSIDRYASQVLTGHGGFCAYLHRFKCRDSPSCACDPTMEEDIFHILLDCPIHTQARYTLQQQIDTKLSKDTLREIISIEKERKYFMDFAKNIVNIVNKRNKDV